MHFTRLDDSATPVWKQEKTELDGHGRPIRTTVFTQGTAPADQVTSYAYRHDGTLQSVSVPDPTANDTSVVTYTYGFDSLGRPASIRRPDHASASQQSGIDITYDGLTQTSTEVVGADGGQAAATKIVKDSFGRLVEVRELSATVPTLTWAVTTYEYGPDDNVETIVDPEGVTTRLSHDFAGRRTQITRHGRTWKYTYDKNGNLSTEMAPGSPTPIMDAFWTTSIAYDALDRPVSKSIGPRDMSQADQSLFAVGVETFLWDYGSNRKGHLRQWKAYNQGSPNQYVLVDYSNDSQGNRWRTQHYLRVAGFPLLSRPTYTYFNIFGAPRLNRYLDNVNGPNETNAEFQYDARGLPARIRLNRGGGEPAQTLAEQTRNVAGLVTKRRTNTTGAMTFVESNWTYDKLGRVTSQVVQKGPGPTQVVRQDLAYFGNDDPRSLTHYVGTSLRKLDFTYDPRHQLQSVVGTPSGYFTANYDYGLAGRFARASESQLITPLPPGTEVKPRHVVYNYSDPDPERLTSLTNVSDGSVYASYTYDEAGNLTHRCDGGATIPTCSGQSTELVYDGNDQLRRATKKIDGVVQGSEEYWYDHDGRRIAVVKRDAAGNKTELIWFIRDVEAHYDGAGNVTHVYSHVSLGTPVARVDRTSNTTTALEYQFHGLASNTIAAVAQDGTINASFSYAPFGEILEATDGGGPTAGIAAHRRRMNDKFVDDISGLAYYGFRYYDKTSMTWTQSDPLFRSVPDLGLLSTPRRASLYQFSLSNPLRHIDPDGLDSRPVLNVANTCALCDGAPAVYETGIGGKQAGTLSTAQTAITDCGLATPGLCDAAMSGRIVQLPFGIFDGPSFEEKISAYLGRHIEMQFANRRGYRPPGRYVRTPEVFERPGRFRPWRRATTLNALNKSGQRWPAGRSPREVKTHDHHILPIEFRDFFERKNLNPDSFTITLPERFRLSTIHGRFRWNFQWEQWIMTHQNATQQQVIEHAIKMMKEAGLFE